MVTYPLICGFFTDLVILYFQAAGEGILFRLAPLLLAPISGSVLPPTVAILTVVSTPDGLEPTRNTGLMLVSKKRNVALNQLQFNLTSRFHKIGDKTPFLSNELAVDLQQVYLFISV